MRTYSENGHGDGIDEVVDDGDGDCDGDGKFTGKGVDVDVMGG